jgi:hypothetical protein
LGELLRKRGGRVYKIETLNVTSEALENYVYDPDAACVIGNAATHNTLNLAVGEEATT